MYEGYKGATNSPEIGENFKNYFRFFVINKQTNIYKLLDLYHCINVPLKSIKENTLE